jgi:RNA recognition motif-containing protein
MSKELYVGSLSYDATEYDLEKLFSVSGKVTSVHLIVDLTTGEFKGCGYVRMSTEAEAKDAVDSLDGAMLIDRTITVSIARKQKMKSQGGGLRGRYLGKKKGEDAPAPAASKPAARPAAAKPAGERAERTASARPSARPGAPKSSAARPGFSKPSAGKTGFSKPGGPRTGSSKPTSSKSGTVRTKR